MLLLVPALMLVAGMTGCTRDTSGLQEAEATTDPDVFIDNFAPGLDYQAFLGSNVSVLALDSSEKYQGTTSLRVVVPDLDNTDGAWAGGAFVSSYVRNLSGYNALTFWAKSSKPTTLDVAGLANDNTGNSRYEASWSDIPLTTTWTKYAIPIPLPAKLTLEKGMFFFAEGPEGDTGHDVWFDDVKYELLGNISNPRPFMQTANLSSFQGATLNVPGTGTTFDVDGVDQTINHLAGYFTFFSSDESVAKVQDGVIKVVGGGTARITAKLGDIDVAGEVMVNAIGLPSEAAPTPTLPAPNVISLFSDAYTNVNVDRWSTEWDQATVSDVKIQGNDAKAYTNMVFAGIEFTQPTIVATAMTHFHIDAYLPQGSTFRVKLVDFGANGVYGGGDDSEHELTFNPTTTPPITPGQWSSLDIPLSQFTGLLARAHLAQLIISSNSSTLFIDNVYLHN